MVAIWLTYAFTIWVFFGIILVSLFSLAVIMYSYYFKSIILRILAAFTFLVSVTAIIVLVIFSPDLFPNANFTLKKEVGLTS